MSNLGSPSVILIADDDYAVRALIGKILSPWGAKSLEAEDENQVSLLANQRTPELFVLDNDRILGVELARDLRSNVRFKDIPIAIMSSNPERNGHGIDGWIEKPFSVSRLASDLLAIVAGRKSTGVGHEPTPIRRVYSPMPPSESAMPPFRIEEETDRPFESGSNASHSHQTNRQAACATLLCGG